MICVVGCFEVRYCTGVGVLGVLWNRGEGDGLMVGFCFVLGDWVGGSVFVPSKIPFRPILSFFHPILSFFHPIPSHPRPLPSILTSHPLTSPPLILPIPSHLPFPHPSFLPSFLPSFPSLPHTQYFKYTAIYIT